MSAVEARLLAVYRALPRLLRRALVAVAQQSCVMLADHAVNLQRL